MNFIVKSNGLQLIKAFVEKVAGLYSSHGSRLIPDSVLSTKLPSDPVHCCYV